MNRGNSDRTWGRKGPGVCLAFTEDKFISVMGMNISAKKRGAKTEEDFTVEDIARLPALRLTKRTLLGVVMSQLDPMGLCVG